MTVCILLKWDRFAGTFPCKLAVEGVAFSCSHALVCSMLVDTPMLLHKINVYIATVEPPM